MRCEAADLIEAQAKQIAEKGERITALEAKCALLAASLAQEERRSAELEAKISLLERARETDPKCVKWYASQHDFDQQRIAELEADRDSWRDQCSQRVKDWDDMRKERDEAKSRIAALQSDLERTRQERNAANVKARREIHLEYRAHIMWLEAQLDQSNPITRLNLIQLEAAKREGYKYGLDEGKRIADEQAYLKGHEADAQSVKIKERALYGEELEQSRAAVIFAGLVLKVHRNDGYPSDLDGATLQELAEQAGMIEELTVTEPCRLGCECQTCGSEFPTKCFFVTEAGRVAIEVAKEKT